MDGMQLVNVSWLPIGQQCLKDFFSHRNLLPIGWKICKLFANSGKKDQ
jgi:hypothetical protein